MNIEIKTELIAPCGMNCGICLGYLREKRHCPGCQSEDTQKRVSCQRCGIKNCELLAQTESGFCYECPKYPCRRLKQLDLRYRTKYSMSMIENLENIRNNGITAFTESENKRWRCANCGGVICVHRGSCYACGATPATNS